MYSLSYQAKSENMEAFVQKQKKYKILFLLWYLLWIVIVYKFSINVILSRKNKDF